MFMFYSTLLYKSFLKLIEPHLFNAIQVPLTNYNSKNYSHARYPFIPPYNTHIVATHSMLHIGDYLNYGYIWIEFIIVETENIVTK